MRHTHRSLALTVSLSLALALGGCARHGEPLIDASNQQALSQSVEQIRAGIADRSELDRLDTALADVARFSINPQEVMKQAANGRMPTKEEAFRSVQPLVDKLSKDELYALATKLRSGYEVQLRTYEKELAELKARQAQVQAAAERMSKFVVVAADYVDASGSIAQQAGSYALKLKLTVQNNLDVPVSKAVMMVNFGPEGSLTPWLSQRVEKVFDQVLQPGQKADIEVFSYFGGLAPGAEAIKPVLDAAMVELLGADGKVVQSAPKWGPGDVTQLNVLEVASEHIKEQLALTATSVGS